MTDPQLVATISALGAFISAVVAAAAATASAHIGRKNHSALQEVHISLDGRLEELIRASHSRGQIEERDNQRAVEQARSGHAETLAAGQIKERDEQRERAESDSDTLP